MAAYAALVSLMNNMDHIQNHPRLSTCFHKKQIESLGEKARSLLDFIESYNYRGVSKEAEDLESQIASAAHVAEDVIESHVVDQIHAGSTEKGTSCSLLDLQEVIQDMNSIKEELEEKSGFKEEQLTSSMPATWSRPVTTGKHAMVGFDDELFQLMDVLTGQQSSRQIISIIGMGGMGKSTLARNVYENLLIRQHFDIRSWATISQDYSLREILSQLLSQKEKFTDETRLGETLYKSLCGRRYLIILDDMWSTDVWDELKFFFPDNGNRSRVVITTRLSNVGIHCGSFSFRMNFLNEDISWILFRETVFGKGELCPPDLEKIGREIVRQCRGLPLSITVIGGLLQKSNRTTGYWEKVKENINLILNSGEEDCLNILSLSYTHLPAHLKPCFLYMGDFQEDTEIRISQIIRLWVAEGFIKPNGAQILEDIAEGYLEDLIDRNLILVGGHRLNGSIKSCRLHDLLRELCLKIGKKDNFFCVLSVLGTPRGIDRERRLIFHDTISKHSNSQISNALQSASLARSLVCRFVEMPVIFRLLRVLTTAENCSPESIFRNFNLRYLVYNPWNLSMSRLPSTLSLIWNLQTLIIKGHFKRIVAPFEIWKMPQLRHIDCGKIDIPDPPQSVDEQDDLFVLENLQTLSKPVNFKWSEEVSKRIPNIRELRLYYQRIMDGYDERLRYHLHNFGHLHKLESLNIEFAKVHIPLVVNLHLEYLPKENLTFPDSLNKLSLTNSSLHWEDLTTLIGPLPHLEVLNLKLVLGRKWSLVVEQFLRLKFLKLDSCRIISWNADSCNFPVLEKLVLRDLRHLEEIPWGIGEIPMLELIRVDCCSMAAAISAVKIRDQRETLGYDGLQIQVVAVGRSLKSFRERVEIEGLTVNGIQLEEGWGSMPAEISAILETPRNDRLQIHAVTDDWSAESSSERVETEESSTTNDIDREDEMFRLV